MVEKLTVRGHVLLGGALLVAAACGGVSIPDGDVPPPEIRAIIDGTISPSSQSSVLSMGMLSHDGTASICTATCVAPNLVLTARHCVSEETDKIAECGLRDTRTGQLTSLKRTALGGLAQKVAVVAGNPLKSRAIARTAAVYVPRDRGQCSNDVVVIELDAPVCTNIAPLRSKPISVGTRLIAVGWGEDGNGNFVTERQQRSAMVAAIGPTVFRQGPSGRPSVVGEAEFVTTDGACHGDSGGPAFDPEGAIAGIASYVTERKGEAGSCAAPRYESIDAWYSALQGIIDAQGAAPPEPSILYANTGFDRLTFETSSPLDCTPNDARATCQLSVGISPTFLTSETDEPHGCEAGNGSAGPLSSFIVTAAIWGLQMRVSRRSNARKTRGKTLWS